MDSFSAYQNTIRPTAIYANVNNGARAHSARLTMAALDLCVHAGAIADKSKKVVRDDNGTLTDEKRDFIAARAEAAVNAAEAVVRAETAVPLPDLAPEDEVTALKLSYLALGLCGESSEVAEKIVAVLENGGTLTDEARRGIISEVGDTLWYLTRLVDELGSHMGEVARSNLDKVTSRRARGVSQGSGDDR